MLVDRLLDRLGVCVSERWVGLIEEKMEDRFTSQVLARCVFLSEREAFPKGFLYTVPREFSFS